MAELVLCCVSQLDHDLKHAHELRQAAFKLYASLGANDEDIRKKVSLEGLLGLCSATGAAGGQQSHPHSGLPHYDVNRSK